MKTWIFKGTLLAAVACLTLGGATIAQAGSCSNASLKGHYAQTISGEILPGPGVVLPQNGIAMTHFDGNGNFTQEDFVVINGVPTTSGFQTGETGTYTINADCTGMATITYLSGAWIDLQLVVVHEGREFYTVVSGLNLGSALPANIGSHGVRAAGRDAEKH